MEYVPGSTLRDLIREQAPLPPGRALALAEQILAALSAAHEAGLVHRDVKPENVLITPDGRIKVADFGLARAVSSTTAATATSGVLIGTVSYLAPELVLNQGADARCDVYACGVVLYEMLTGRKPHQGESPIQVAYKHVHEDVPAPSLLMPRTPPYVDALVARATARDRDLRPADAKVLLQQVRLVRSAVGSGIADDAELTADLTPHLATVRLRTVQAGEPLLLPPPPTLVPEPTLVVGAEDREVAVPVGVPTQRPPGGKSGTTAWEQTWARSRRRGWALIALVVALAIAAAAGGWYLGVGRFTTMPDVEGATGTRAQAVIEDAGLSFEVSAQQYSDEVPEGAVISTDPAPDERVIKGDAVSVVLSKGEELYLVPEVVDLSAHEAQRALKEAHLRPKPEQRYNASADEGVVFNASPSPGTELPPGESVTIYVSMGPRPIAITDTSGQPLREAREELERLGFTVPRPEREFSDEVVKGAVLAQTPSQGTGYRGDAILLTVSKGPELAEVPSVIGYSPGDAEDTLQTAGFEVRTRHDDSYIGGFLVVGQEPGGGQQAPVGSTVTIYVV
jgi:serine/threonine-protein kinase